MEIKIFVINILTGILLLISAYIINKNSFPFNASDLQVHEIELNEISLTDFCRKAAILSKPDSFLMQRCQNIIDTLSSKAQKIYEIEENYIFKLSNNSWFGYNPETGKTFRNKRSWRKSKAKRFNVDGYLFKQSSVNRYLPFLDHILSSHFDFWNQKLTGQIYLVPPLEKHKNLVEYGMVYFKLNNVVKKYYYANTENFAGFFDENYVLIEDKFHIKPVGKSIISSPYNLKRIHPVTKEEKPHYGTDYAGNKGDNIYSIAKGKVLKRGFDRRNGNYVKIKHNKNYDSQYLHMDKLAPNINVGSHIDKGQIVGYMGETGMVTGVHLCYRFWHRDRQINHLNHRVRYKSEFNILDEIKLQDIKEIYDSKFNELKNSQI